MVICLERGADLHMAQLMPLPLTVSCFSKIQIVITFWYWLTWVVPDKGLLNVCVCVCVHACVRACLCVLSLAMSLSSSGSIAIHFVHPVLWKMSCFHLMTGIRHCEEAHTQNDSIEASRIWHQGVSYPQTYPSRGNTGLGMESSIYDCLVLEYQISSFLCKPICLQKARECLCRLQRKWKQKRQWTSSKQRTCELFWV